VLCTELQLERQCLLEQQQKLELHHQELSAAAESLTTQLLVTPSALVVRRCLSQFIHLSVFLDHQCHKKLPFDVHLMFQHWMAQMYPRDKLSVHRTADVIYEQKHRLIPVGKDNFDTWKMKTINKVAVFWVELFVGYWSKTWLIDTHLFRLWCVVIIPHCIGDDRGHWQ